MSHKRSAEDLLELSDLEHSSQIKEEKRDADRYLNRSTNPRPKKVPRRITRHEAKFMESDAESTGVIDENRPSSTSPPVSAATSEDEKKQTTSSSDEKQTPAEDDTQHIIDTIGDEECALTQELELEEEEEPKVSMPPPRPVPDKFSDPNEFLKKDPLYFQHINVDQLELRVNTFKGYTKPHLADPEHGVQDLCFWTPFALVDFVRAYPLGDNKQQYPTDKYNSSNPAKFKFSMCYRSEPAWHPELRDQNGQDKNVVEFFRFINKVVDVSANAIFSHPEVSRELVAKVAEDLDIETERRQALGEVVELTEADEKRVFLTSHVSRPISRRKLGEEARAELLRQQQASSGRRTGINTSTVPFTERMYFTAKVFQKVDQSRTKAILKSGNYNNSHPLFAEMLKKGYIYNDIPMYDASNIQKDANGKLIPLPLKDRMIKDGDVVSLQVKANPYSFVSTTGCCGITWNIVGIMYLRPTTGLLRPSFQDTIAPRGFESIDNGWAVPHNELGRVPSSSSALSFGDDITHSMLEALETAEKEYRQRNGEAVDNSKALVEHTSTKK